MRREWDTYESAPVGLCVQSQKEIPIHVSNDCCLEAISLINRTAATAVFRWPSCGLFNDPDWARRFALKGPLPALLTLGQEAPDKHLRRSLENSSFK